MDKDCIIDDESIGYEIMIFCVCFHEATNELYLASEEEVLSYSPQMAGMVDVLFENLNWKSANAIATQYAINKNMTYQSKPEIVLAMEWAKAKQNHGKSAISRGIKK